MYKRKILSELKSQSGFYYKGNIAPGKFGDVVLLEMPSGESTAGKIVSGDQIKENEIQVWPLLQYKNIVKLQTSILMPDLNACCFVMPRQFMNLNEIVKTGWFKSDEYNMFDMKRWLLDTLSGVAYLHSNNLCHLNISASNVLVSYDSIAKLGGFSLLSSSTQPISG